MPRHKSVKRVEIDGRTLEGGGQLIRIALCLSALTGTSIKIINIRGNRSRGGGLKAQHLACVKWLARASNARIEGAAKGSKTLIFEPREFHSDLSPAFKKRKLSDGRHVYETRLDIETAGSTGLALQAILPFILFFRFPSPLPVLLTISGGTNVSGSPSYDYITQVLLPTLHRIGLPHITASLATRGWSHGGASSIGTFMLEIPPRDTVVLPSFSYRTVGAAVHNTSPDLLTSLHATFIGPSSAHTCLRSALPKAIHQHLSPQRLPNLTVDCEDSQHPKRIYLLLVARIGASADEHIVASDWLYDRRISDRGTYDTVAVELSERVASILASECRSQAFIDVHLRDQLVIFQALATGKSQVFVGWDEEREAGESAERFVREASLHAQTAEWVSHLLLGAQFDGVGGCDGIGFGSEELNGEALLNDMQHLRVVQVK